MPLDPELIRRTLDEATARRLGALEVFGEIDSTNTYLMQQPGPVPGHVRVAVTDNQTAGRGRHGRTWQSPAGSGLCLSMAYSFASNPAGLPALTLAIGLGAINALQTLGVGGVQLKWPNDLILANGKLGGILTEAQTQSAGAVTVVTGIGVNIDLSGQPDLVMEGDRAPRIVDLKSHFEELPARNDIAASLIIALSKVLVDYDASGFEHFSHRWRHYDWLFGKTVTIDTAQERISGIAAGVAADGALLVDTQGAGRQRVTSGTVTSAALTEESS